MAAEKYSIDREQAHSLLDAAGRSEKHGGRRSEHAFVEQHEKFTVLVEGNKCKMYPDECSIASVNLYRALTRFWLVDHRINPVEKAAS